MTEEKQMIIEAFKNVYEACVEYGGDELKDDLDTIMLELEILKEELS